ncbi:MAG: helix-turn-helix transcriptional regulator [Proteobacteria bacterium]|nr:helix-turn-helix transcriptional regulator [Pseudomonadota bacterium]
MYNFQNNKDFSRPFAVARHSGLIDSIADWSDALRGGIRLQDAFAGLAAGLRAEAGMLVRTALSDFRPARVAIWDRHGGERADPLGKSFADGVFGSAFARPRPASLWLFSEFPHDDGDLTDPALGIWQTRRGFSEFMAVVLESGATTRDHIELHFRDPLSSADIASIEAILPTMARTWSARQVGLVTRCIINHRRPETRVPERMPLLSITNPAHLSRAEFRVCLLLSRGLSPQSIADELTVSDTTIRTHLRNIYAKTETTGMPDLVYNLIKGRDRGGDEEIRSA